MTDIKQRLLFIGVLSAGAVVLMALALIFVAISVYAHFVPTQGPVAAALIVAGGSFVIALILMGTIAAITRNVKDRLKRKLRVSAITAFAPLALRRLTNRYGGFGALAAMLIGYWTAHHKQHA